MSGLVGGCPKFVCKEYSDLDEAVQIVDKFFQSLKKWIKNIIILYKHTYLNILLYEKINSKNKIFFFYKY